MIKYKAKEHGIKIEEVEVVRETGSFVFLNWEGRKEAKNTTYYAYFDTYAEAKEWLVGLFVDREKTAKLRHDHATKDLEKAESL